MIHYAFLTVFIIVAVLDLRLGGSSIILMSSMYIGAFGVLLSYGLFRRIENFTTIFFFFTIMFMFVYGACILLIVFSIIHYTLVPYGYIFFSTISLLLMFNKWRTAQAIKKEKERKERERIDLEKWKEEIKRENEEKRKNYKPSSIGDDIVHEIIFWSLYVIGNWKK